jgi:putative PIN family toxin of toxin-antitoxin system
MRAVFDTNILARAFCSKRGPAAGCLDRILAPPHVLMISSPMLLELERVLAYPRLRAIHGMTDEEISEAVAQLGSAGEQVEVSTAEPVVQDDPDDDVIVATAVVGGAERLCTRDAHLHDPAVVAYCAQRGIRVLDDSELLAELRGSDQDRPIDET